MERPETHPWLAWPVASLIAGVVSALAGFVLALGGAALGWIDAPDIDFTTVLSVGGRLWLLAHGVPASFGPASVSLTPLGFTGLLLLICAALAGFAAHQVVLGAGEAPLVGRRSEWTLKVTGLFLLGYLSVTMAVAALSLGSAGMGRALVGGSLVGGIGAILGAARRLAWRPTLTWPVFARAIPRAVGASVLLVLSGGAVVAGTAIVHSWRRVAHLHDALHAGTAGGILLIVLQLAYLPNFVLWAASWLLGAGFAVGTDTLVSPGANQSGLLPTIPVFGAVPQNTVASRASFWWLLIAVAAGVVAAVVVLRSRRRARFDETAVVGGLSGVASGLLVVGLAWLATGGLGIDRMADLGPRLGALIVVAPTSLGLAGLVTGLGWGLLRRPESEAESPLGDERPEDTDDAEPTGEDD